MDEVVKSRPAWGRAAGAVSQCAIARDTLLQACLGAKLDAEVTWVIGPRGDRSREHSSAREANEHALVRIEDCWIDLTRRQWDSAAEHPTLYRSLKEVGAHWSSYYADGERRSDEFLTPLPR